MVKEHFPFDGHFLDRHGLRYHYLDEGQGTPVLMVHGNPTWSFYYRRVVKALRGDFRCIVPDHIGCGLSDKPSAKNYDYTLTERVADLDALITSLKLGPMHIIAHDWGGMIALGWATNHPEKVKSLTLMNTAGFRKPESKKLPWQLHLARTPWLSSLLIQGLNAFSKGANVQCMTKSTMPADIAEYYLKPYDSWQHRVAVHRFVQDIPLSPKDPAWDIMRQTEERLPALASKPILLPWGMRDFVFDGDFLNAFKEHFPAAKAYPFEDVGHYILEDAPDEVIPLITEFVRAAEKGEAAAEFMASAEDVSKDAPSAMP